jgi:adenylate cyclase
LTENPEITFDLRIHRPLATVPVDQRIEFRFGIHQGDIIIDDGDIFGDGVNLAARLEGLAEPGGICVSRVVRDEIRDKLAFAFDGHAIRIKIGVLRKIEAKGIL